MSYFADLATNRRRRVAESMRFGVYGFKRDGTRRASPTATERTESAAIARAAEISKLNGDARYVVEAL